MRTDAETDKLAPGPMVLDGSSDMHASEPTVENFEIPIIKIPARPKPDALFPQA
jgi:hypothetical protein